MMSTESNTVADQTTASGAAPTVEDVSSLLMTQSDSATKEAFMRMVAQEMAHSLMGKGSNGITEDGDSDNNIMKLLQTKYQEADKHRTPPKSPSAAKSRTGKKTRRRSSGGSSSGKRSSKTTLSPSKKDRRHVDTTAEDDVSTEMDHEYLAKMYYAQMNGGGEDNFDDGPGISRRSSLVSCSSIPENLPVSKEYEMQLSADDIEDDDSFAGGDLDSLLSDPNATPALEPRKRLSGSTASTCSGSDVGSCAAGSATSATPSDDMNVNEIREYVLQSIPKAIRDQIPEKAWGEIFSPGGAQSKSSKKSKSRSIQMTGDVVNNMNGSYVSNEDDDEVSQISDVSGFTNVFPDGRRVENKQTMVADDDGEFESGEFSQAESSVRTGLRSYDDSTTERNSLAGSSSAVQKVVSSALAGTKAATTTSGGPVTKKVAFSEINMRYYERILTDNPAVQSGPAIGIGWRYKRAGSFEVDWYEQSKGTPRSSDELVMQRPKREKILRDAGYSSKEIAEMVRVILKTKNHRKTTVNNLSAQNMEEAVESAKKRVGSLLRFGKSKGML
eukprot:CAMPEP_0113516864 /NCGR_PEP_ID=MMETSP0014_2-20120614/41879_1 /TAXON_ID=2857 /ORGANISM="Nitzschia sp." /LENGTH=555 /DNA_ID=CAMNT_0000413875 /DNA_START=27 /DNA_END=1694 /DNA_ORIENTATION=+ /assembly_acc=CAM_ASM_000159